MASACRPAAIITRRAVNLGSRPIAATRIPVPKSTPVTSPSSPATLRFIYAMGGLETMLPLHSAIASSRLKSNIAMDTSCWSWLSQDFAIPR